MKEKIIAALKNVQDPEIPVDIWELGLVYDIVENKGKVKLTMTMTSPTCPMAEEIMENTRTEVAKVPGVSDVEIELVWTPAWDLSRMSEEAKLELDLVGMGW